MAQKSSFIPLKVLLSYLLLATLVIAVGFLLFKENKLFTDYENESIVENQKLIHLSSLISKIYDVDNLGRIAAQNNKENDFRLYYQENQNLIKAIDSFKQKIDNAKQIEQLDSLKIILEQKVANITALKKINTTQNDYSSIEKAVTDIRRMEESMGKITLEGLNINPTKLSAYEKKVYQEYVDYLNENVPKESASTLSDKEIDSILVSSKKILENVRTNNQVKTTSQKNKEIELLRNDLFISQKLNEILVEFESDIIKKANLNNLSREEAQQKTVSILTSAAVIGLLMTGLFFLLITNDFLKNQRYRKQLEIEKKKTQTLLIAREQLIATVSHDLRTPLNTIQGFSELVKSGNISEKQNYYISNIQSASVYINQLVNDLLDFSKIEAGKIKPEISVFNLHQLIEEVALSIQSLYHNKTIFLQFELNAIENLLIESDALRIRQIMSNLIGNAYKFTENGFIKITAKYNQNQLYLSVQDSGIGIKKDQLHLIFNEFTQANSSIEKKYGGTGLGLTICKKLTEMLGGNLTVESEFGQGSTFQMILPAKSKKIENTLLQNSKQNHNYTLAVVDDDSSLLQLTTTFLKLHQFNVLSFNHPKELLEALHTSSVDVVFTDIQMPEMSGFELLEQIPSSLPVIAITGQRQWEKEYYKNKGFAALLYKPYTSEELISVLNQVLHTPIEINQKQILKKEENTTEEYNLSVLKTMLDNDQEAIRDVLYSYIENTRSSLIQIEKAIEEKNYSLVESISHRMIPMTHQVGAYHIVRLLQELETCKTSNISNSALQKLFNEARNKLTNLIDTLQKELIL